MFEPYNPYNLYNQYYNNYNQQLPQMPRQQSQPYKMQNMMVLQGKVVDSLDVVKATDIPYDGSVSYFPLTDNSAIITKQLQQDGTSKMVIYKPISENDENKAKYITENEFCELMNNINSKYITEDNLKQQLKTLNGKDIQNIKEDIKTLKRQLEDITDDLKYSKKEK